MASVERQSLPIDTGWIAASEIMRRCLRGMPVTHDEAKRLSSEQVKIVSERRDSVSRLETLVGVRSVGYRFAKYDVTDDKQRRAKEAVQEWADTYTEKCSNSLVLFGPVGTGKDHLAFAALRQVVMQHGVSAQFCNGRELFTKLIQGIRDDESEQHLLGPYRSCKVLLLSDPLPPVGELSAYQADVLYRLIDYRYRRKLANIVTINVTGDQEARESLGTAAWDRICDGAWKILCSWKSDRKPARTVNL